MKLGAVNLADGRGGHGGGVELGERFEGGATQFRGQDGAGHIGREGRDLVLEGLQLADVGQGQQVGPGGEQLADLDEGGAHAQEAIAKALGVAALAGFGAAVARQPGLRLEPVLEREGQEQADQREQAPEGAPRVAAAERVDGRGVVGQRRLRNPGGKVRAPDFRRGYGLKRIMFHVGLVDQGSA